MISGPIRIVTGMCFLQRKQQSRITVLPVSGIAVLFRFCCKYRIFSGDSKILANSLRLCPFFYENIGSYLSGIIFFQLKTGRRKETSAAASQNIDTGVKL